MDEPSTWETVFRALAAKPPEFWRRRRRRVVAIGAFALLGVVGLAIVAILRGDGSSMAGLAVFFAVAYCVAWHRFYGVLMGAAESRVRDAS